MSSARTRRRAKSTAASTSERRVVLAAVAAGLLVSALDAYVVAGLLPSMVADVGVPLEHLERATPIISGFLFGYVAAIPLLGALSDLRGRTAIYLGGLLVFAAGSILTAQAQDLNGLVAGRLVQGFAGGALVPVALAMTADLFDAGRARVVALGVVTAAQEVGSLLGPLYGAEVAQHVSLAGLTGWRTVFWLNVPLALVCALFFITTHPSPALRTGPPHQVGRRLSSSVALSMGMGLLTLALYPDDPVRSALGSRFLPLAPLAAVALLAYGVLEWRTRLKPAAAALAVNLLLGAGLVAALAEVPVLGLTLFGLDQTAAALLLGRFLLGVPVGALAGGQLGARSARLTAAGGMALAAGGFALMSGWSSDTRLQHAGPFAVTDLVLLVTGAGFGLVIAPVTARALEAAGREEHGAAAAAAVLARMAGMLGGLAVLAAYGLHRFYGELAACPRPSGGLGALSGGFLACATGAARDQYHDVFLIAAACCGAAALLALAGLRTIDAP